MGVEITAPINDRFDEILTDEALSFLERLHREFEPRRRELLEARTRRSEELSSGGTLLVVEGRRDSEVAGSRRLQDVLGHGPISADAPDTWERCREIRPVAAPTDSSYVVG